VRAGRKRTLLSLQRHYAIATARFVDDPGRWWLISRFFRHLPAQAACCMGATRRAYRYQHQHMVFAFSICGVAAGGVPRDRAAAVLPALRRSLPRGVQLSALLFCLLRRRTLLRRTSGGISLFRVVSGAGRVWRARYSTTVSSLCRAWLSPAFSLTTHAGPSQAGGRRRGTGAEHNRREDEREQRTVCRWRAWRTWVWCTFCLRANYRGCLLLFYSRTAAPLTFTCAVFAPGGYPIPLTPRPSTFLNCTDRVLCTHCTRAGWVAGRCAPGLVCLRRAACTL